MQARIIHVGHPRLASPGIKNQFARALSADAPEFINHEQITLAMGFRSHVSGTTARMGVTPFFVENDAVADSERFAKLHLIIWL